MDSKSARSFLQQCYRELEQSPRFASRWREVRREIELTGTYWQTLEELTWGARAAWRNHARCIGRLFWKSLAIFDCRHLSDEEEMAQACFEHLRWSTNGGRIRPAITVFRPRAPGLDDLRIENPQLISYAGFEGRGDPLNRKITRSLQELGWSPPIDEFVVMPLRIGERWFELPPDAVMEVPIRHPEWEGMADWGVRWYALPAVSDMELEMGGVIYTAAPFSGYYMLTEVGSRDLGDKKRFNLLPRLAQGLGYFAEPLWQDRALYDLNRAVLHSYQKEGVTMIDHHLAAEQFARFCSLESAQGRPVSGDWSWLVPPTAGSTTPVFFMRLEDHDTSPAYRRR